MKTKERERVRENKTLTSTIKKKPKHNYDDRVTSMFGRTIIIHTIICKSAFNS